MSGIDESFFSVDSVRNVKVVFEKEGAGEVCSGICKKEKCSGLEGFYEAIVGRRRKGIV